MTATFGDGVVISTGTLRTVNHGIAILAVGVALGSGSGRQGEGDLQDGDEKRVPKLLRGGEVVTIAVESTSDWVIAVSQTDKDPDHDHRAPASEAVVALEETAVNVLKRNIK